MYEYSITRFRGELAVVWYDTGAMHADGKPKRHRHTLGTVERGAAESLARPVVVAAWNADHGKNGDTVGELVANYFATTEAIGLKNMRSMWKQAAPYFGNLRPEQITTDVCKGYAKQRKRVPIFVDGMPEAARLAKAAKPISPSTIAKELGIVRAALVTAKKDHAAQFWFPPQSQPRDVRMTRPEFDLIAGSMDFAHLVLFALVARYTAGRSGAILELTWDQIDFDMRRINLRHTGRQKRRGLVPMHPNLAWALALAKSVSMTPYVIEYAGRRVFSVKKGFAAAVARAGLPRKYTPHVLRHTSASWMAEAGIRMEVIAQFLGHTNSKITERVYARFSPTFMQEAMQALG